MCLGLGNERQEITIRMAVLTKTQDGHLSFGVEGNCVDLGKRHCGGLLQRCDSVPGFLLCQLCSIIQAEIGKLLIR
jgi:hypothetical protein